MPASIRELKITKNNSASLKMQLLFSIGEYGQKVDQV